MKNSWNNLSRGRKIVFAIIASFVVLSLVGALFGSDTTNTSNPSNSSSDSSIPQNPESAEDKLAKAIRDAAGDRTNLEGYSDRIKDLSITDEMVSINLMGSDNLTEGLVKGANRNLVLDAIKAYQNAALTSEKLSITIWFPMVDNLGNAELDEVLIYEFSSEQVGKINPDGVDTKRMDDDFADLYTYIHPAFEW
jgi:hypothetical protein